MTKTIVLISLAVSWVIFLYVRVLWSTRAHGMIKTAVVIYQIMEAMNGTDVDDMKVAIEDIEPFALSVLRIFNWEPLLLIHDPDKRENVVEFAGEFAVTFIEEKEDE